MVGREGLVYHLPMNETHLEEYSYTSKEHYDWKMDSTVLLHTIDPATALDDTSAMPSNVSDIPEGDQGFLTMIVTSLSGEDFLQSRQQEADSV